MNSKSLRCALYGCTLSVAGLIVALPAQAAPVDCGAPRDFVERRACQAASQGVEALRRYAERTRNMHNIYLNDYARAVAASAPTRAAEASKVASTK